MNEIWSFAALVAVVCAEAGYIWWLKRTFKKAKRAIVVAEKFEAEVSEATRKAQEYFDKIEEVISEREVWRKLYHDQALGHDNAQGLMMRQIDELSRAFQRETGKRFKLNPTISKVRGEWDSKHGKDERGRRDTPKE